jgi:diguanylate cyclase (GGDEF)-like protein/PAS domain S-box-containing protein
MSYVETIKVLLIEDEPGDAGLVQVKLHNTKVIVFKLIWVETLTDAKIQLTKQRFDVLLLDLSLPDSSGLETLKKAQIIATETPIIILTGQNNTDFALKALKIGASDYLVKGDFSQDSLIKTIRYTLQRTKMEKRNLLLVAALKATANGIIITDRNASIKWANPAFTKLTGYSLKEAIGHKPSELVKSSLQPQPYYQQMWQTLLAGKPWRGEIINKRKDGSLYNEELNIAPVLNKAGVIEHFIGIKEDISSRKRMEEKLKILANTDPLTGLFNRRVFLERLEEETERLNRSETHCATLLMLDLDFFKQVNDNYGHATGDKVLCCFANVLTTTLRSIDLAARLGGEEFAILLPSTTSKGALIIAERLRLNVANNLVEHRNYRVKFTVSIGIASLSKKDSDYENVLHRADAALYTAKDKGRNQSCLFSPTQKRS